MNNKLRLKAIFVKKQIEKDFNELELEETFDKFKEDKRTLSFLKYYHKTVLDKEKIDFGEFKGQWKIQGMTKEVFNFFTDNFNELKEEIEKEKNIKVFFKKYCCAVRKEVSFCSKLFHTIIPDEFPPLDNPIKKKFHLQEKDSIENVLIIKGGYELFIKENQDKMKLIRKLLSKPKFHYLRSNELSDIRILDMYHWFKASREDKLTNKPRHTVKISKRGEGKTLYIELSVFLCGKGNPRKNLTISCPAEDTRFKTTLSDNGLKKFKEKILEFYNEHITDKNL